MQKYLRYFILFLFGSFLFVGLPIFGFGLENFSTFFSDCSRILFVVGITISNIISLKILPNDGRGSGEGERTIARQKIAIFFLQIVPLLIMIIAPYSAGHNFLAFPETKLMKFSGLILVFLGNIIMNLAVLHLGKQFSVEVTIQKGHQLITSGIYKKIRHPRYLGILLMFLGINFLFYSIIGLIVWLALLLIIFWRIYDEERLLADEFGQTWLEYVQISKKLVPFIY